MYVLYGAFREGKKQRDADGEGGEREWGGRDFAKTHTHTHAHMVTVSVSVVAAVGLSVL